MNSHHPTGRSGVSAGIDWAAIHDRLEHINAVLEQGSSPSPVAKKETLKKRAHNLSRSQSQDARNEESIEVVEFLLAYERYGIESSRVSEVSPLKELTPLPGTPAFILGIINVRGRIVSIVDLKAFFHLPSKGITDFNKVIIIDDGRMEFGLLADAVANVRQIAVSDIQPPPSTITGIGLNYLKGIAGDRLILLDAEKLLTDPKMRIG